jgi:hypothetical protein
MVDGKHTSIVTTTLSFCCKTNFGMLSIRSLHKQSLIWQQTRKKKERSGVRGKERAEWEGKLLCRNCMIQTNLYHGLTIGTFLLVALLVSVVVGVILLVVFAIQLDECSFVTYLLHFDLTPFWLRNEDRFLWDIFLFILIFCIYL